MADMRTTILAAAFLCLLFGVVITLAGNARAAEPRCAAAVSGAAMRDASEKEAGELAIGDWTREAKAKGTGAAAWATAEAKNLKCAKADNNTFECTASAKPCVAEKPTAAAKKKPAPKRVKTKPRVRRGSG